MSRRASFLVAFVAAVLVLFAVSAAAAVPRCDEDGSRKEAASYPAVVQGSLSYNGVSGCADGVPASFDIVESNAAASTIAKLNNWNFIVAVRSADPVVYTLDAKCNSVVVCEAQITFDAPSS